MIAHIDADAFFASALQRKFPKLRGKPLLALGMGGGCVIAASYEAKAFGVKTGMRFTDAKKLCPHALSMPSDFDEALLASQQIENILKETCPIMEQMSVDEWYLDIRSVVGGIPKDLRGWASLLQKDIALRTGLTVSIGIGTSKLQAKMAGEYKKPAGCTVLELDISVEDFLKDRPAEAIPGIGRRRSLHSQSHGWRTAWDIATANPETIVHLFGKPGREMQLELLGTSIDPVAEDTRPPQSISRCRSFPPSKDISVVFAHLLHHVTYTVLKLRRHHLGCMMVGVWLRNGEYEHDSRMSKIPDPLDTEEQLLPYITKCFRSLLNPGARYTQTGLVLAGLKPKGATQYSLFEDAQKMDESEEVQKALDRLHERYGRGVIKRGSAMPVKADQRKKLSMIK